jgi:hypothetical protein
MRLYKVTVELLIYKRSSLAINARFMNYVDLVKNGSGYPLDSSGAGALFKGEFMAWMPYPSGLRRLE